MYNKSSLLKATRLFSNFAITDLETIAKYSDFKSFKDNEVIFEQGTVGQSLFIVRQGAVRIIKYTQDRKARDIAQFIKGELFGELDLFEKSPRTATAVAEKDTILLLFPAYGIKFEDLTARHPDIFARVLHILLVLISKRIRSTNTLLSEKTRWVDALKKQIHYDKLTGLYNKSWLQEDFPVQLNIYGKYTSIAVLKPDNFKYVNDTYGHEAGDKVLKKIAETLKKSLGKDNIIIRFRGDEFVVVFPGMQQAESLKIAVNLIKKLHNIDIKDFTCGDDFKISFSIGIATFPENADSADNIIKTAFKMMMKKRNSGGSGVMCAP